MAKATRMFDPNKPLSEQLDLNSDGTLDYFELGAELAPFGPKYAEKEDLLSQAKMLRGTKAAPGKSIRTSVGGEMYIAPHALENVGNLAQLYAGQKGMKEQYGELGVLGQQLQANLLRTINRQRERRLARLRQEENERLLEQMPTQRNAYLDDEGNPVDPSAP